MSREERLADFMWERFAGYTQANPNNWAEWAAEFYEPYTERLEREKGALIRALRECKNIAEGVTIDRSIGPVLQEICHTAGVVLDGLAALDREGS